MAVRGPAELEAWIERSRLDDCEVARRLGISRAYMSQILHGRRTPSLGLCGLIFELTGVPPRAWLDMEVSTLSRKAG